MTPVTTNSTARWLLAVGALASLLATAGSAASRDPLVRPSLGKPAPREIPEMLVRSEPAPCPSNMALVNKSCVDKYEAALVEVHPDGTETPFSPHEAPNGYRVRAISRAGVVPQAHISMVEAKRACSASHKRLCRANEWKAACKGPSGARYPYGNARVPNACVDTNRTSPMLVLFHGERTDRTMNDARANQIANTVEATGSAASCTNEYGVHDMVGNVHEWTDDGSFRGGYYLDTKLNGEGCDYRTTVHAPTYYDYSTGFRCCSDVGAAVDD
jgi:hypothetical protein